MRKTKGTTSSNSDICLAVISNKLSIQKQLAGLLAGQCNGWYKGLAGITLQKLFYFPDTLKAGDSQKNRAACKSLFMPLLHSWLAHGM
jgi:hypothetical protein